MEFFGDPETLIRQYGYIVVLIGAFLEGESVILIAGYLASMGYLEPRLVALLAFTGSVLSDQIVFGLARRKGAWLLGKFPRLARGIQKLDGRVGDQDVFLILTFRFVYGMRNITPVYLALKGTSPKLFMPLNVVSAAVWAVGVTALGFYLGELFGAQGGYGPIIMAVVLSVAAVGWMVYRARKGRPS